MISFTFNFYPFLTFTCSVVICKWLQYHDLYRKNKLKEISKYSSHSYLQYVSSLQCIAPLMAEFDKNRVLIYFEILAPASFAAVSAKQVWFSWRRAICFATSFEGCLPKAKLFCAKSDLFWGEGRAGCIVPLYWSICPPLKGTLSPLAMWVKPVKC